MSKQSSENYLDQLLNSMNVKTSKSKDKQVQALEKEIESVKKTLKLRDENSFYEELESELVDDEYGRFVSDFESEIDEYELENEYSKEKKTSKKEQKRKKESKQTKKEESIEVVKSIPREEPIEEVELIEEVKPIPREEPIEEVKPIPREELIEEEPIPREEPIEEIKPIPEEEPIQEVVPIVQTEESVQEDRAIEDSLEDVTLMEQEVSTDSQKLNLEDPTSKEIEVKQEEPEILSLEDLVLEEVKPEEIQAQEAIVQDLSGLSEEELDKLLAEEDDFVDLEKILSGDGQIENLEGITDFEAFAQNEMPGVVEIGDDFDLDTLIPDVSNKKESFIDKIKKLFSKKGKDDKVNLATTNTDVNTLADENQRILEAFDKEEGITTSKKKGKKKKKKEKTKKPKKEKKPKAPKKQKPKKEKKPKEVDNTPPLPKKPVILIWLWSLSMLGLVLLLTNLVSYSMSLSSAKNLMGREDYSAAFTALNGLEIKEKDIELYNQISTLAPIDSEWDAYVSFKAYDRKVEAFDSLVCAAGRCEVNRESAVLCGVEAELNRFMEKITKELAQQYGVTYQEAIEVYNSFDRQEYSIRMNQILERLGLLVEE